MITFKMKCSCGDKMSVEADSREEAVSKMKNMFDGAAIAKHMSEKHAGQPVMSVAECHAMIEKDLAPA